MKKYKQKNTYYLVGENEAADSLLFLLEHTAVLPPKINDRIRDIVLGIVSNYENNKESVMYRIDNTVVADLECLNIYTKEFVARIKNELYLTVGRQRSIEESKKSPKN